MSKGIAEDKAIFSRGCFFITQEDNSVLEVGKLVDDAPKWNGRHLKALQKPENCGGPPNA